MKVSIIRLAILTGLLAFSSQLVQATILVNEPFDYADGPLVGKDPAVGGAWIATSGAGTNPIQVTSGGTAVNGNGEDAAVPFEGGPIVAGTTVYSSFDLTVPTGSVTTNAYFAHFKNATTFFGGRVWMTAPSGGPGFRLALSGDNSITDADGESFWGSNLAFDTTYQIVTAYNFDTGATSLWIDPSSEASTSISATDVFAGDAYVQYQLRQSTANSVQRIDNLVVATTFNEAAGIVPEPASLALAGLSLLGLLIRRK